MKQLDIVQAIWTVTLAFAHDQLQIQHKVLYEVPEISSLSTELPRLLNCAYYTRRKSKKFRHQKSSVFQTSLKKVIFLNRPVT